MTATLKFRQALPPTLRYQPREPPNLLTLPQELRDRIYYFCDITAQGPKKSTSSTYIELRLTGNNSFNIYHDDLRPTKRRKLEQTSKPDSKHRVEVLVKTSWPSKFPDLRLVCWQLHNELVGDSFRNAVLNLIINTSQAKDVRSIDWDVILPKWATRHLGQLTVELRCSMSQWKDMQVSLSHQLRQLSRLVNVKVRIIIMHFETEQDEFMAALPAHFRTDDFLYYFRIGWARGNATLYDREFEVLKAVTSVGLLQILFLDNPKALGKGIRLRTNDIARVLVFTNDGSRRVAVIGTHLDYGSAIKFFEKEGYELHNLR